jgi:hypothetical protein
MDALFDLAEYDAPRREADGSESCDTGDISELEFLPRAKRNGWHVFTPHGHSTPADVIVFRPPNRPLSVQIKKGVYQHRDGKWKIIIGSGKPSCAANPKDYGTRYTKYERGDFDVLAMYVDEHDCFVFWLLEELLERGVSTLRWSIGDKCDNWEIFESFTKPQAQMSVTWAGSCVAAGGVTSITAGISIR